MEASKCPKCGEEPFFIEHVEKWYCYSCNSYVEDNEEHVCEQEKHEDEPETAAAEQDHASKLALELEALEQPEEKVQETVCGKCGNPLQEMKDGRMYCLMCEISSIEGNSDAGVDSEILLDEPAKSTVLEKPIEPKPEAPIQSKAIPVPEAKEIKMCSTCGHPLKWIEKYSRHYCYSCRKYAPKEDEKAKTDSPATETKKCPDCGSELHYVEKYDEHYCYKCKKYPLQAKKTVQPKTVVIQTTPRPAIPMCAKCDKPLKFIEQYSRFYCYECKEYAPKSLTAEVAPASAEKKECPVCHDEMKFITQYNEWYCFKCKKYPLRPSKPVLLL
jgi:predicted RNA-binding Zn-ribbon protein involved in translation (DUF1610 family)